VCIFVNIVAICHVFWYHVVCAFDTYVTKITDSHSYLLHIIVRALRGVFPFLHFVLAVSLAGYVIFFAVNAFKVNDFSYRSPLMALLLWPGFYLSSLDTKISLLTTFYNLYSRFLLIFKLSLFLPCYIDPLASNDERKRNVILCGASSTE